MWDHSQLVNRLNALKKIVIVLFQISSEENICEGEEESVKNRKQFDLVEPEILGFGICCISYVKSQGSVKRGNQENMQPVFRSRTFIPAEDLSEVNR